MGNVYFSLLAHFSANMCCILSTSSFPTHLLWVICFWADGFQIYLNCWDFVLIFIMCFEVFADSQNSTMEIVFSCSKVTEPLWLISAAKLYLLLESLATKAMVSVGVSTPLLNFRSLLRKISLGPLLKLGIP